MMVIATCGVYQSRDEPSLPRDDSRLRPSFDRVRCGVSPAPREASAGRAALFGGAVLLSAFLLFGVQPMAGKALLPRLGGVPAAWTACLLFFQAALLVGYGYVWASSRWSLRARVFVHVLLVAGALAVPVAFSGDDPSEGPPVGYALAFLAMNVGLPFTVLSATSPLLQSWFATVSGRRPYFLYATSNVGSLGALAAYPFVLEPFLDLPTQALAFRVGLALLALCLLPIARVVVRARDAPTLAAEVLSPRRRARWVLWSFVPSMLLAGATSYVSLDLAPMPLLWVLPLGLYLLSFILAFSERVGAPPAWIGRAANLIAVVLILVIAIHANEPVWLLALLHFAFLFLASWVAHGRLATDAPQAGSLPEFFVWSAFGGVLGTLVSVVIAPLVFPDLYEYPLAIALACALVALETVTKLARATKLTRDLLYAAGVGALLLITAWTALRSGLPPRPSALLALGPAALLAYRVSDRSRRYALCLVALIVAGGAMPDATVRQLSARSFFGVLRVVDDGPARLLLHGSTVHGVQDLADRDRCIPLAYYAESGPLGAAFEAFRRRPAPRDAKTALAIGLGTGAVACYARPGERWRFVEIDPSVAAIASNPRWFTYLERSRAAPIEVDIADGRRALEATPDASLDLLVVDAFNSDAVPLHLLTREALSLYLQKLRSGGWALLHISSRSLDLESVFADGVAAVREESGEGVARLASYGPATWLVLARGDADLAPLDARWAPLPPGDADAAWTDAFSSLWSAVAFRP